MSATLPATHLLRQVLLFAAVVVFLGLFARAGYALWRFPAIETLARPERLFLTGLRFDLSLAASLSLVPLVVGAPLAMFELTRELAKWLVIAWLAVAMVLVLVTELVTPYLIASAQMRPVAATFADAPQLLAAFAELGARQPLPSVVGALLALLILIAYLARMQISRFLRYRLSRPSALALALLGGLACVVLARSGVDPSAPMLSVSDARLGGAPLADQIAMNSAWTTLRSLLPL